MESRSPLKENVWFWAKKRGQMNSLFKITTSIVVTFCLLSVFIPRANSESEDPVDTGFDSTGYSPVQSIDPGYAAPEIPEFSQFQMQEEYKPAESIAATPYSSNLDMSNIARQFQSNAIEQNYLEGQRAFTPNPEVFNSLSDRSLELVKQNQVLESQIIDSGANPNILTFTPDQKVQFDAAYEAGRLSTSFESVYNPNTNIAIPQMVNESNNELPAVIPADPTNEIRLSNNNFYYGDGGIAKGDTIPIGYQNGSPSAWIKSEGDEISFFAHNEDEALAKVDRNDGLIVKVSDEPWGRTLVITREDGQYFNSDFGGQRRPTTELGFNLQK